MKITSQLLRSRALKPLPSCESLDLANQEIDCIDKLHSCPKLRTLNLRANNIDYVSNLDCCPQLWKLDLSNNKIKNLDGIRRFVAMGALILSNNNLSWAELSKLQHIHILDLSLHGNQHLEKDPYYRIHVIDTLPNVWMLDGRIITSAERVQAQQFFHDSALTDHPVRHKVSKDKFTPTNLKKIEVSGVFGERTDHLMRRFPVNGALNIDTDRRRLKYLAYNIQEDLILESKYIQRNYNVLLNNKSFLEDLLEERAKDRVRCNMMLLLLVASLEFAIPITLMQEALLCAKLDSVGNTSTMQLFLLSRETRCLIVSLLLSAVKVDKDVGEEGGLYDKLYLCLYYSVSELTKLSQGIILSDNIVSNRYSFFRDSKCLIASEVVQLLCIVPAFFNFLTKDAGVMNLVAIATSDPVMIDRIHKLMKRLENDGCDQQQIFESVAQLILTAIQHNALNLINKRPDSSTQADFVLNTKKAIPKRPLSTSICNSEYLATGRSSPEKKTARLKSGKYEHRPYIPLAKLGEKVLLGPQNIGRVISVPEPDLVLIQMDAVPAETGAMIQNMKNPEEHYTYVDMTQLYWDNVSGYWRPKGTIGDRITIKQKKEAEQEMVRKAEILGAKTSLTDNMEAPVCTPRQAGLLNPPTAGIDLVLQEPRHETPYNKKERDIIYDVPQPVSSRYKQQFNLKLELKMDTHNEEDSPGEPAEGHPKAGPRQPKGSPTTDRHSRSSGPAHPPSDDAYLFQNLQSAIVSMKQRGNEGGSPTPTPHCDKVRSDPTEYSSLVYMPINHSTDQNTNKTTAKNISSYQSPRDHVSTTNHYGSMMDDDMSQEPRAPTPSRRSSLESIFEPELASFVEASRPSTAHSGTSTLVGTRADRPPTADTIGTPAMPIEIPQVREDQEEAVPAAAVSHRGNGAGNPEAKADDEGLNLSNNNTPKSTARATRNVRTAENRVNRLPTAPRPISAIDSYRMIVSRDSRFYTSQYQSQRTEAWKSTHQEKEVSGHLDSPPPQPPCSPKDTSGGDQTNKQKVKVQYGEDWLGGGRDLHWERQRTRPKTAHVPGWMEGMPQRPKSAAAIRALKRAKTPNIITPSSMAYESLYALDVEGSPLDDYVHSHSRASPVPRGYENQMLGTKLVSHPFAKYVYVMRERNKMENSVMCHECTELHQKQEEDLQKILGRENSDLIEKLVSLEPCSHKTTPDNMSDHLPTLN